MKYVTGKNIHKIKSDSDITKVANELIEKYGQARLNQDRNRNNKNAGRNWKTSSPGACKQFIDIKVYPTTSKYP